MSGDAHTALSDEARRWLLAWARRSIRAELAHEPAESAPERPPEVEGLGACFVSLHTHAGELRGCIGTFDDSLPLWRNVEAMAKAAATHDYRFSRLTLAELDTCAIEISALSPRQPIKAEDVIVGEHGLWIASGVHHGVLLPQVAVSHGWDRETFLAHTCIKAGLPQNAWRDPHTEIEAFRGEVFSEHPDDAASDEPAQC